MTWPYKFSTKLSLYYYLNKRGFCVHATYFVDQWWFCPHFFNFVFLPMLFEIEGGLYPYFAVILTVLIHRWNDYFANVNLPLLLLVRFDFTHNTPGVSHKLSSEFGLSKLCQVMIESSSLNFLKWWWKCWGQIYEIESQLEHVQYTLLTCWPFSNVGLSSVQCASLLVWP